MPRLAGIVDLTDDLRAEMSMAQNLGSNIGKTIAGYQIQKEKKLNEVKNGILAKNLSDASRQGLDPGQTLDLLLQTDPQARAQVTRDQARMVQAQAFKKQQQPQEKDLMARLDKSMKLRDQYWDESGGENLEGGIVPGREREYNFFDKQVKGTLDILQGGGTSQQPQQSAGQRPPIQDIANRAGGYMQQTPEMQGEITIGDKPPADFAKLFEDVERTLAMGKGATPEPGEPEKAGFTQAQTAGQTPAEFYKYFDKLDDVSRQQLMQILQGSDEEKKKIALERLRKTYGPVR